MSYHPATLALGFETLSQFIHQAWIISHKVIIESHVLATLTCNQIGFVDAEICAIRFPIISPPAFAGFHLLDVPSELIWDSIPLPSLVGKCKRPARWAESNATLVS